MTASRMQMFIQNAFKNQIVTNKDSKTYILPMFLRQHHTPFCRILALKNPCWNQSVISDFKRAIIIVKTISRTKTSK